jgi:hypothetical protein
MRNTASVFLIGMDNVALYCVQPLIAVISIVNLEGGSNSGSELMRPFMTWGGIVLLQLIFVDDIWSFAVRHEERRRIGILWIKLLAAGICSILTFAGVYRQVGLIDQGQFTHDPMTALYFSVTAWSTVGFGDVIPSIAARPYAAAQSFIGVVYDSAVIGLVLFASTRGRLRGEESGRD